MARLFLLLFVLASTCLCLADDRPNGGDVPPPIRAAKARYDDAEKQAEAAYRKAQLAAKNAYLRDIQAALVQATKSGNLDLANKLNDVKAQIQGDINELNAGRKTYTGKVLAASDWQAAKRVEKGDVLKITATGKWCSATQSRGEWTSDANGNNPEKHGGANNAMESAPYNALIGRIGKQVFLAGTSADVVVEQDGLLEFRMNQNGKGSTLMDGELIVTVKSN